MSYEDVENRYKMKVEKFCGGLDPYMDTDSYSELTMPSNVELFDIRLYFMKGESYFSRKEFSAKKSVESITYYESAWVQHIRGKAIENAFIVIGKVIVI